MNLLLRVKGASREEISRGVLAAEAVLERAGITAEEAAEGMFALEGWDISGFPEDGQAADRRRRQTRPLKSGWKPSWRGLRHAALVGLPRKGRLPQIWNC
ncbi:hypothetical protein NKI56_33790 [Mesorhizobium sp. M0622]